MTSKPSDTTSDAAIYVVGAGSKIFRALCWDGPYVAVSGRADDLKAMPAFPDRATILVFADPSTADDAIAMMASIIGPSGPDSDAHIIFISSISALFDQSNIFPGAGPYSRRKKMVERFLQKSKHAEDVSILRLGNVFECGGWKDIVDRCGTILLPNGFDHCAASSLASIRGHLVRVVRDREAGSFNLWETARVDAFFEKVRTVPGLVHLYRSKLGRILLKIATRLLRKARIYLPSPDDIDSFNPGFVRAIAA